jgi:group I intron endonuclease
MKKQNNGIIGIYKITNPKGRIYIGQSLDIENRWKQYNRLSCKKQIKLYNSLNKYKPENHVFEIIEECNLEKLNEREIYWVNYYNSTNNGLNIRLGGYGGGKNTEEQKINLRKIHNYRAKSILQYDLEGNFIKEWESINEIYRSLNIDMSALIQCVKKLKQTSASGYQWIYKTKYIEEKIQSIENNKNKGIYQIDTKSGKVLNEFYNIKQAIHSLNLSSMGSGISSTLSGRQKQAYGFKWIYKNKY